MYWIKMLLFVFILINIKINDQGHCSDVTTALVEYDDVSDGNLDLPVTKHEVTDGRVDRSVKKQEVTDEKTNTPVQKHGLIDAKVDRLDKKFKVADVQKVAGSESNTSNVTIVADINAIGSVNNTIGLRNNVTNVETYGIFENDTVIFTFNVADFNDCHGDALCNFKVDFGKDVAKYTITKFGSEIEIHMKINNEKAEAFILESNSFTTTINKDGKITIEDKPGYPMPTLKELKTIPTKDNQQAVRIKFDGSELRNASVKLYFKTKVGKIFEEPERRWINRAGGGISIFIFVIGALIFIAGIVVIICLSCPMCPYYKPNAKIQEEKNRKRRKKRKHVEDLTQNKDNQANSNYNQIPCSDNVNLCPPPPVN